VTWIWLPLLVLGVMAAAVLAAGYIFSTLTLYSHRQPIVRTPREYGMEYEDVEFHSTDGLRISGWFLPVKGVSDRAVIMTHPFPFNRHGFLARNQGFPPLCGIDVDLLTTARALHEVGYPVLMFDFRNHGESAAGRTGVGLTEYQDVLGAAAYLRGRPDLAQPEIGFVSFCMGANATLVALAKGAEQLGRVRFAVAVQPVSADVFVRQYLRARYTPLSSPMAGIVDGFLRLRGGYPLKVMSPLPFLKDVKVPILFIQAPADRWTTTADTQGFYDAAPGEKEIWWIEGITRRFDTYNYVGEHPGRIIAFAQKHF
jgi:fermentation-respiration switch protein FrsA (DUF1100 family)